MKRRLPSSLSLRISFYQGTDNLAGVLPEVRYGTTAGIALSDNLGLALEYVHDEDYDENDGGTDESADACTIQLALGV